MSDRAFDALHEAILDLASPDVTIAEVNRITEELSTKGVKAWMIRRLVNAGLTVTLGEQKQALPQPAQWYPAVQRWPVACRLCGVEVVRGELVSLGKLPDQSWTVECLSCRELKQSGERAKSARMWALAKDDDPDSLLAAILEHTPADLRQEVEDDLTLALEAGRG
jgi:hypothetical protein